MRFELYEPVKALSPYVKHLVISENTDEQVYRVFPSTSLVIGFQYRGRLSVLSEHGMSSLSTAGITGISGSYKVFRNSAGIGTLLVVFTEIGFSYFSACPAHELFKQSVSLDNLFNRLKIEEIEGKLLYAITDQQRIQIVERFLLAHFKYAEADKMIVEAVRVINQSKGNIRISELNERLFTSKSPLEKRFRRAVGTTPKKFASLVRFNAVLSSLKVENSLSGVCYGNNFFDQAHFIKDFKQFTGYTPESFRKQI